MGEGVKDCVLNSVCCDNSLMIPAAWYGEKTTYRCLKCSLKWTIDTNTFSRLPDESKKNIIRRDLDFKIILLEEEKKKLIKNDRG